MELKDQIRIAREALGLDQPQLAELVGVSKQAIIWWETGENVPRIQRLRKLEEVLNIKLNATGNTEVDGSLPNLPGVRPEDLSIAVAISRLPKSYRDALITMLGGLIRNDTKIEPFMVSTGLPARKTTNTIRGSEHGGSSVKGQRTEQRKIK